MTSPETQEVVQTPAQSQVNVSEQKVVEQPETQQQIDWKRFKAQREVERKQKEEAEKVAAQKTAEAEALKAAMDAILNKGQQNNTQEYGQEEEVEDSRINKAVEVAIAKRDAAIAMERSRNEAQEFPKRLISTYNDFNEVCSTENLDYLQFHYPEIAEAFKHAPDGFDKWSNVYKTVKRFVPNTDPSKDKSKMEKNLSKPQSMSSTQSSQTAFQAGPNILTEERRAANYARMKKEMGKGGIG